MTGRGAGCRAVPGSGERGQLPQCGAAIPTDPIHRTMTQPRSLRAGAGPRAALGLLLVLTGCRSAPPAPVDTGPSPREAALLAELREAERRRLARALERDAAVVEASAARTPEAVAAGRARVQRAELELQLTRDAGLARRQALEAQRDLAARRLAAAQAELEHFEGVEAKLRETRAQLTLDLAASRVAALLERLEAEGASAALEAELGLRRQERALAAAERGDLLEHGLPARRAALELEVEAAAAALAALESELGRVGMENGLRLGEAKEALAAERAAQAELEAEPEPRS